MAEVVTQAQLVDLTVLVEGQERAVIVPWGRDMLPPWLRVSHGVTFWFVNLGMVHIR